MQKDHEQIEIHTTRVCLPMLTYHSKCYSFSLVFLTIYDKVYMPMACRAGTHHFRLDRFPVRTDGK